MSETKDLPGVEQPKVQPEQVSDQEQASVEQEQPVEANFEQAPASEETVSEITASVVLPQDKSPAAATPSTDIELKKVESVLSQGLESVFLTMDIATQANFKAQGEETAKQINTLLHSGKAKMQKVITLIINWLRLIPRVNKHFLEQEAKIKADEIMRMYQQK
jgi:hypothetical protein